MKKIFVLLSIIFLTAALIVTGNAEKTPETAQSEKYSSAAENSVPDEKTGTEGAVPESSAPAEYYARVWNAADGETKRLMEAIGVTADGGSFDGLTPGSILKAVYSLFSSALSNAASGFCTVLAVMAVTGIFLSFQFGSDGVKQAAECTGAACIMFSVLAVTADISNEITAAIALTENYMLAVIPVFTGVVAMSGSPTLALSFNSVAAAFAQLISGAFCAVLPSYSSAVTSIAAAGVINPFFSCDKITGLINKLACSAAAFISGVFVTALSVKGVLAGAADSAAMKGLRFLVGSAVPVVGSAISDALGSVTVSLGLIRHSVGAVALVAVGLTALPAIVKTAVCKILFSLLSLAADIMQLKKISGFIDALNGVFSFCAAVLCFNAVVFIISIALVLLIK